MADTIFFSCIFTILGLLLLLSIFVGGYGFGRKMIFSEVNSCYEHNLTFETCAKLNGWGVSHGK